MKRALLALLMLLPAQAMAAVDLSLPLNGYWRAGKYMPVRVSVREGGPSVEIGSEGTIPVRLSTHEGRYVGVVPLMVMSDPGGLLDAPMRQLGADQRLVGFTTIDLKLAQDLFPGTTIVPVQLNATDPLPGPAIAWETLDAVVLDNNVSDATQRKLDQLPAFGVVVVRRPGDITKYSIAGPRFAAEDLAPFAPVQGWAADWPVAFRRGIFLCAVAFSIIALGVGLMRFKHSALILVVLCAAATAGLAMWWKNRPTLLTQCGVILVRHGEYAQEDLWIYQATASGSHSSMPFGDFPRPYFESKLDRVAMKMVLICGEAGPREFDFHLLPGQKIGFLIRSFVPGSSIPAPPSPLQQPKNSPLHRLANRMYLHEGLQTAGEFDKLPRLPLPQYGEQWPTLVIESTNH